MNRKKITILDGGMGRELERRGAPFKQPQWSAVALAESPEIVKSVHKAFIDSGAHIITTNSYALVPFHLGEERFKTQSGALAERAGKLARLAVEESGADVRVAGSIPPLFGSYRPDLFQPERVEEIAGLLIHSMAPYVDFWICETQSLIEESLRVKELLDSTGSSKPVWVSFTLKDDIMNKEPRLRSGESVAEAVRAMAAENVGAVLFNCCRPESIGAAVKVAADTLKKQEARQTEIGAYANAFPPQPKNAVANSSLNIIRADLTADVYLDQAREWHKNGATILGGCCGIGPEHIAALAEAFTPTSQV